MGLISETTIIKWGKNNRKWYESKGYIFTKYGDEFEVKIENLTCNSNALVEVKCDCEECKNPYLKPMKLHNFKKCVKEDGKYYCKKCSQKLFGVEKTRKTKLKNGTSFEQWCIDNNRLDILDRWDYELNNCKPNEISYGTNKKYYFICPRKLHESELKCIAWVTSRNKGMECNKCNSFAQWGIDNLGENFLEKYWDYEKNININPWIITKKSNAPKVWIKCQEKDYHDSYDISCANFTFGWRCPYCQNKHGKIHPLDSLGKLLEDKGLLHLWSDKNIKSPYEYAPYGKQDVWWKCPDGIHEDFLRNSYKCNISQFHCVECTQEMNESFLQEKVRIYLEDLNYTIFHESKCSLRCINPKTKMLLPYDNEIKINNNYLLIEVMGLQHYEICGWHKHKAKNNNTTPEYELHKRKLYDRYKRIFAKKQGYFYLEIPYWTDDSEETWRKLIDDKIKEVKLIIERNN